MAQRFTALILAAGHGTRMRSSVPKVLHRLCGRPMVQWVIEAGRAAGADPIVCVVRPGDGVAEALPPDVLVAEQTTGEGTAAAVLAAREQLDGGPLVVLSGDHPLLSEELLRRLLRAHADEAAVATVLTTEELDPAGYGRVVRAADGTLERIVETKSTEGVPPEELAIREINLGTYVFEPGELVSALDEVPPDANGERYLTGVFPLLRARGRPVASHRTRDAGSGFGVNSRVELMEAEQRVRRRLIERHARAGVTFEAPDAVVIDADVEIGADTTVAQGVSLRGATRIGRGCQLGPHTTLIDAVLGDEVTVRQSFLVECEARDRVSVGPFAHLRPGTVVREDAKVGSFVEIKNSDIGRGAKVPHLSYVGDSDVGDESNLGASTITANYDGRRKHRTKLGKRVKTGVHTSLVAPLSVGDQAYTGAGSVITDDVPDGALGISRPEQKNVEGYAERVEEESRE